MKLIIPTEVFSQIRRIVDSNSVEIGVRLIGIKADEYKVLHVIGPGTRSVQEAYEYECDNTYFKQEFARLLRQDSNLEFIGELHVHPSGFPELSGHDRWMVKQLLKDFPFFIAGVIQRSPFSFKPICFTETTHQEMEVECELYTKPERTGTTPDKASRCRWLWECGKRHFRDARQSWRRKARAHRSGEAGAGELGEAHADCVKPGSPQSGGNEK
jgi:proteasome lid subunit RPN8/RPN11